MAKITDLFKRWGLAFLMMVAIFAFSSIPAVEMPDFGLLDFLVKKGGHALGYGLLALTYLHGLRNGKGEIEIRRLVIAWVLATMYSATDEFHQSFVPGRFPAVTDVMIDSLGAASALFLVNKFYNKNDHSRPGH